MKPFPRIVQFHLLFALSLLSWGLDAYSEFRVHTQIPNFFSDHSHNPVSPMIFEISGDDFAAASPEAPIYLRISFTKGSRLNHTLVDIDQPSWPLIHRPIYLPIQLATRGAGYGIHAPADSVSIIRWRKNESEVWLAIRWSSTSWINGPNGPQSPTAEHPVRIDLGLAAATHWLITEPHFREENANLPAPVRDLEHMGKGDTLSTLLCVNPKDSTLSTTSPSTDASLEFANFTFFDQQTIGITTSFYIDLGPELEIDGGPDTSLGQLIDSPLGAELELTAISSQSVEMCPENQDDFGLYSLRHDAQFRVTDLSSRPIKSGTRLRLTLGSAEQSGFRVLVDENQNLIDGFSASGREGTFLVDPESLTSSLDISAPYSEGPIIGDEGQYLAKSVEVRYRSQDSPEALEGTLACVMWTPHLDFSDTPYFRLEARPVMRETTTDLDPDFQGSEQPAWCGTQFFRSPQIPWPERGRFERCQSVVIQDSALRTYLLSHFDLNQNGVLDFEEAPLVDAIDVSGQGVRQLTGLAEFSNLHTLLAGNNKITSLEDLDELPHLRVLELFGNRIRDLVPLADNPAVGDSSEDRILLEENYLNSRACEQLSILQARADQFNATLNYQRQGDRPFVTTIARWAEQGGYSVLDMISLQRDGAHLLPQYPLECE
ncbi:Leucine-rich repeat domain-containing protein [Sulfidibacter corallicola]|uniref:Leucine-rich repeat domain-containing protein n=1 Tax=Sulfidibacter corallicola TaxID=2818388 RepID=A0A8A4TQM9_SULCO|nr:leucine-rich repeat domain-containing protein [Sulfidibacter corallicola]QTD48845.1 leucine-rich repeat domain-containing protein [Sulfidibacter corallicola]